jgi:hypothetical protein
MPISRLAKSRLPSTKRSARLRRRAVVLGEHFADRAAHRTSLPRSVCHHKQAIRHAARMKQAPAP